MSDKQDGWQKVGGSSQNAEQWKPVKTGESVAGQYIEKKEGVKTNYGPATIYVLKQADGSEVAVFGKANIDRQMAKVDLGNEVRITFLGLEKNPKTGFDFKKYEVETRVKVAAADLDTSDVTVGPEDMPF